MLENMRIAGFFLEVTILGYSACALKKSCGHVHKPSSINHNEQSQRVPPVTDVMIAMLSSPVGFSLGFPALSFFLFFLSERVDYNYWLHVVKNWSRKHAIKRTCSYILRQKFANSI